MQPAGFCSNVNRVGEVYEWTMDDDIFVVVAKRMRLEGLSHQYEWECRSLTTTEPCWLTESWFDGRHGEYIRRLA
jgi:hypothetical protein